MRLLSAGDERHPMKIHSKSRKINKAWLSDHVNDPYVKLARKDGYRSRAAYKLEEIDQALGLIRPGQFVIDLGCAPGAWCQYVRRRLAPDGAASGRLLGAIVALDLLDFEPVDGVHFIQGDFRDETVLARLVEHLDGRRADLVLSDMAPNLSGVASADAARVAHLVELAVDFALRHLQPRGVLVCKMFHGSGYSQLVKLFKDSFRVVKPIKPRASRGRSAETFLVGIDPKPR